MAEVRIECQPTVSDANGNLLLRFTIDDLSKSAKIKLGDLTRKLVGNIPDLSLDLIEIASWIYAIDSAVSRGGLADQKMGKSWHRVFNAKIPVREHSVWNDQNNRLALEELIYFLSGDRFHLSFYQLSMDDAKTSEFLEFGGMSGRRPNSVMMFSGGLDSFAGALEEIIEHENRVLLVSHASSTKIQRVQKDLYAEIVSKLGEDRAWHLPANIKLNGSVAREGTHRTRSFLFASLGIIFADLFRIDQLSFYENGVVSLNLPPVNAVTGTKATRTTHPQTLARYSDFFSLIFSSQKLVRNPYFWRTKHDVLSKVQHLGFADQIPHTRSCADVHNITNQYSHCGRCSQCIDRRFAALSAGLKSFDPEEAYRVDLMNDPRKSVTDREMALSYVRSALYYEQLSPNEIEAIFPQMASAISFIEGPASSARDRIADLLRRHGQNVLGVLRAATQNSSWRDFPEDSLPRLFGALNREAIDVQANEIAVETKPAHRRVIPLVLHPNAQRVSVDSKVDLSGKTGELVHLLAENHLAAAGSGLDLLDYPFVNPSKLEESLGLDSNEALRQRVRRSRTTIKRKLLSAEFPEEFADNFIESSPWKGYRLRPEYFSITRKA